MTAKASTADIVLDVREVSVSYGGVKAVDEVTFEARRGQIVGFIGPNGAGKTTVFDAICGFVQTQSGRVVLDGNDITDLTPTERARRGLGRSFQDARLFSSLTVFETLACAFERHARGEDPVSAFLAICSTLIPGSSVPLTTRPWLIRIRSRRDG
jgi:branched-chain amino acid transport system ATP-binding protein